jgi:oligoribonuclease
MSAIGPAALVWVDCEMTDLGVDRPLCDALLLEIAVVVTDKALNPLGSYEVVLHVPEGPLSRMSDWCKKHHGDSGLTNRSRDSRISAVDADRAICNLLASLDVKPFTLPLCGNSVSVDRLFINRELPNFGRMLHYRTIDVTSLHLTALMFNPMLAARSPAKRMAHTALSDIEDSIAQYRHYADALARCSLP